MFLAPAQPANDNFANRTAIVWPGTDVSLSGTLANATFENGEPFLAGISSGQTAWWTWTAPTNGLVTFSVAGKGAGSLLTVYTGNDFANLSLVASNNYLTCYEHQECGCHWRLRNQTTFHVGRGQVYQVAVDSPIVTDVYLNPNFSAPPQPSLVVVGGGAQLQNPVFNSTAVQTTNVVPEGDLQIGLHFVPAPKNDDFDGRTVLVGSLKRLAVSNEGATREPGEPDHSGNPGGSSVWYSWKAPASGRVTLSTNAVPPYLPPTGGSFGVSALNLTFTAWSPPTCGREIDQNPPPVFYPLLAAYTGTNIGSLISANVLPVALDAYPYAIEFDVAKGQTYQIACDGNLGATGTFPLFLALTKPASNDNFRNRIPTHGIRVAATGYNAGATPEAGEPLLAGSNGKSVWWSWTAPVSGPVAIDLGGSDYTFPVGVFTGTSVSNLTLIAADTGAASFDAVLGQTYKIAVNDASGLTGAIKLKLRAPVLELPLARVLTRSVDEVLLSYTVSPHQVVLLQSSTDGATWKNVRTALARQATVNFLARPAPTNTGPYYRAIVVDYQ